MNSAVPARIPSVIKEEEAIKIAYLKTEDRGCEASSIKMGAVSP